MKIKILAAALAATTFATPALAADFGGPRIEVRAGWDSTELGFEYDDGEDGVQLDQDEATIGFGAEIGYDASFGGGVAGVYAGVDFAQAEICNEVFGEDEACISAKRNLTLGVRGGIAVTPMTLLYVKGGYSNGRVSVAYEDFEDILEDFDESESRGGFHLGVGGEVSFGTSLYGKAEFVHTRYNDYEVDEVSSVGVSRNQVLVGVGFRF